MLGPVGFDQYWQWAAYGKHPAARDYLSFGQESGLAKGFSDWVEAGYREVAEKRKSKQEANTWRFWARGPKKDMLACGLLKDSSDTIGRSYPLLIIGSGPADNWDKKWDLLPLACEKTWEQIEYLSTHMFSDFKRFQNEVQGIRPPYSKWSELSIKMMDYMKSSSKFDQQKLSGDIEEVKKQLSSVLGKTEGRIWLDQNIFRDEFASISSLHIFLKENNSSVPNAVFMGGGIQ